MTPNQKMKKPIFTSKAPAAIGPYSQAVQWGDVVFISGQIPLDPENGQLNNATFEDETNQVLDNLEAICQEAGGTLDHILKLTIYLTDLSNFLIPIAAGIDKIKKIIPTIVYGSK